MRPIGELGVPRSHPDYMKLYRAKNREKINASSKKYADKNREKVRAASRKASAKWQKENPAKVAANNLAYYANKKKRMPKWADRDAIEAFYEEARRLTEETGVAHHVDHIIPLQGELVSGLHVQTNLQVLTAEDNISKSNNYRV